MSNMVLGVQLYTCREFCKTIEDIAETLRKVGDIGYSTVQISGFGPVDPAEVAGLLAETHLACAATHVDWDECLNDLDTIIETHKLWNCTHTAIGMLPKEYHSADGLDRFLDELPGVAEKLAAAGIDFSYHNHNHEFVRLGGGTWLDALYDCATAQHLKAELDTYWIAAGGGDPAAWVRKLAGRQPLLHLKDMVISVDAGRKEQRFAEIGEGNLNWPEIIRAGEEGGVEYALVEQDNCYGRDPFESLAISYRNLREMGLK